MNNRKVRHIMLALLVLALLALTPGAMATEEEEFNKALALRWVQEFMLTGSPEAAAELVTPDFTAHNLVGQTLTLDALTAVVHETVTGSISHDYELKSLIAEGDSVALRWVQKGCCIAVDHGAITVQWDLNGIAILRFAEGRIAEMWYGTCTNKAFELEPSSLYVPPTH